MRLKLILQFWIILKTFQEVQVARPYPEICWSNSVTSCQIIAEVKYKNRVYNPVKIGCDTLHTEELFFLNHDSKKTLLFQKGINEIDSVSMSGCFASGRETFGFEYIPNREIVEAAKLRNFKLNKVSKNHFSNMTGLKELVFFENQLNEIEKNAFNYLKSLISLYFRENHIHYIENGLFDEIPKLKNLTLIENKLIIYESNQYLFSSTKLTMLSFSVEKVDLKIFEWLPTSLQTLHVKDINFNHQKLKVINPSNISDVHITKNKLSDITILDTMGLEVLNLSYNTLRNFVLVNLSNLCLLDLRNNEIGFIRRDNFKGMFKLEKLYLQSNCLKTLTSGIFEPLPMLEYLDLSNNNLKTLRIDHVFTPNPRLKIVINKNPWSCFFLLELFTERADVFYSFMYEKFSGEINVNGIECVVYPFYSSFYAKSTIPPYLIHGFKIKGKDRNGDKRYTDVAIIVGFLFVGVAILAFILFLWIRCQKVFHLAFYRSIGRRSTTHEPIRAENLRGAPISIEAKRLSTVRRLDYKEVEVSYEKVPATVRIHDDKKIAKIPRK